MGIEIRKVTALGDQGVPNASILVKLGYREMGEGAYYKVIVQPTYIDPKNRTEHSVSLNMGPKLYKSIIDLYLEDGYIKLYELNLNTYEFYEEVGHFLKEYPNKQNQDYWWSGNGFWKDFGTDPFTALCTLTERLTHPNGDQIDEEPKYILSLIKSCQVNS